MSALRATYKALNRELQDHAQRGANVSVGMVDWQQETLARNKELRDLREKILKHVNQVLSFTEGTDRVYGMKRLAREIAADFEMRIQPQVFVPEQASWPTIEGPSA